MSKLIDYWPSIKEVNQCIRTEAEAADDAVLLAVHEPTPLFVREAGTGAQETKTESDLLDEFLRSADDGSAVVVAITGDSGVGKSHMIRWLNAQLQRHADRDRFVIVLIPKTASLRKVVELMLEPLAGAEYDLLRNELGRVTGSLGPEDASRHLATSLTIELKACEKQWIAELRSGNTADRSLRERALHARGLQNILFQGETFDNWLQPVLLRIVEQALRGGSESTSGNARRFVPADFALPESFDITAVSQEGQRYIQNLQGNDGSSTLIAARVLQDVLDPALRGVFRFSEALGHRSLEEIVNDIRARLLEQNKELVLLIEDFAALAGIQETLLSLMISESDHSGRRIRAPLRTALAVTDGFLPSRQTILTRAKREWVIPNYGTSDEDIFKRLTRMAGRYLNAARWGIDSLRNQYANNQEEGLYSWVKHFEIELDAKEQDDLDSFGVSDQKDYLFPFSSIAISSLVRREMTVDGKLLFNPRRFINSVLRDVLLNRELQVQGNFPPPNFKSATLKTDADLDLRARGFSQGMRDRFIPTLVYWAGDPRNLIDEPLVSKNLFKTFSLPWPFQEERVGVVPPQQPKGREKDPPPLPSAPTNEPSPSTNPIVLGTPGLDIEVEGWATGALSQSKANRLRHVLANALSQRMEWNSMRMTYGQIIRGAFWLPFVQTGNPTSGLKIVVAPEIRPVPATIRRALIALDHWDLNGSTWDYSRSEEDYAYAQLLLDVLEIQARKWFITKSENETVLIGRTLHRQSLLLGLSKRADPSKLRLADMLGKFEAIQNDDNLRELTHVGQVILMQDRASQSRDALRKLYLSAVSCFQGDGSTPYAIDMSRVVKAWKSKEEDSEFTQVKFDDVSLKNVVSEVVQARLPSVVLRFANAVEFLRPKLVGLTGKNFDKTYAENAKAVISKARKLGTLPNQSFNMAEVDRALEFLQLVDSIEFVKAMNEFKIISDDLDVLVQLNNWGRVNLVQLAKITNALEIVANLIAAIQRESTAQLRSEGGADVAEKMTQLIASLNLLKETT
jgi:hypothetical protein